MYVELLTKADTCLPRLITVSKYHQLSSAYIIVIIIIIRD